MRNDPRAPRASARRPLQAGEIEQLALSKEDEPIDLDDLDASLDQATASALRVPEELTPLPEIDRAMPVLRLFGAIAGSKRARLRIAVLKSLQMDGSASWKLPRMRDVVHWLEPAMVSAIVLDLKSHGVLAYDPITARYRLTPEARIVTAVLGALTIPELDDRRLIRALKQAMALAVAAGASEDVLFVQFRSAVAVLQADEEELTALIDERSDRALLAAAERIHEHVVDMRELMDEHRRFFATRRGDAVYFKSEHEALDLVRRLGALEAEIIELLSGRAEDRMRGGVRVDRADLREFLSTTALGSLTELIDGLAAPAPALGELSMTLAFESLERVAQRQVVSPPPLPEPARTVPAALVLEPDLIELVTRELRALEVIVTVADFAVRESWNTSVARHGALLAAYSGARRLPRVRHELSVDEVRRGGVWKVSRSFLEPAG